MGLDNGITLITREKLDLEDWEVKPDYVSVTFDEWGTEHSDKGYEYEVCYWRKCWNVRSDILEILDAGQEGGIYRIETVEQVLDIREALVQYLLKPERWSDSIWSMDEIAPHLARDIMNLGWLVNYMKEHEGEKFIIEFYDSY